MLCGLCLASHDAISKVLTTLYPIMFVVWLRYLAQTVIMAGMYLPKMGKRLITTQRPGLQFARGLSLIGVSVFIFSAVLFMPLGEATAVMFLAPVVVVILSALVLKEKISAGLWASVICGVVGVAIIVRPGGELFTWALLLPLAAAVCFGVYQMLTRRLSDTDHPATSNFLSAIMGTVALGLTLPWTWTTMEWQHLLLVVALAVLAMSGHMFMTYAYRFATAASLAPFTYGQIVVATIWGALFFDHFPDAGGFIGMAIIILSGVLLAWGQHRRRQARKALETAASE